VRELPSPKVVSLLAEDGTGVASPEIRRAELSRNRILSRAWAETLEETRRTSYAALFTRRALEAMAQKTGCSLTLDPTFIERRERLDEAADRLAVTIGYKAAELPLVEGLHFITGLYPALLTQRHRGALGAFYTPPALAARLLDLAAEEGTDWRTARVLDPAAGGGIFLVLAALRMREAMRDAEPIFILRQLGARLTGLELDRNAAGLAQAAVEIALVDLARASGRSLPTIVRVCDTLEEPPHEDFDLVLGNPPYGRVALSPDQRVRFKRSLYGHANLYGIFTDLGVRWSKHGGLIAYVTPTSFLGGRYFGALRGVLAKEAPPVAFDFVHARRGVFEDVLQETLLAIYRKGEDQCRTKIHYLRLVNEREANITRNGAVRLPKNPAGPWLTPKNPQHGALIANVLKMPARLSDWGYSVSTGPLVWNRFKPQLRAKPGGDSVYPLIWAECVTADGFIFRARKRNHAPYFQLGSNDGWLLVRDPCILVQRTTAKEQPRRLIAAELPSGFVKRHRGVIIENHVNMIRPIRGTEVSLAVVAALLNSSILDELFRCMNGSVAVSAFELEALPLPDVNQLSALTRLVSKGAERARVDAECIRLYAGSGQ